MENEILTAGVDIGSLSAQAVILRGNEIVSYSNIIAGANRAETSNIVVDTALEATDLSREELKYIVGTGYGRYQVPFANKNVTEITCHARGINYYFPNVRTLLDMGGQDCKAISCGGSGQVMSFVMNEKCAAGTGRSIEIISKLLDIPLEEIGPRSLDIKETPPVLSNTCVVFAKSEALQLIRKGIAVNNVLAAYCDALARKVLSLISRIGMKQEFAISGGIAKNIGVVKRIQEYLGVKANICDEPQIVGAVGAALIAQHFFLKMNK